MSGARDTIVSSSSNAVFLQVLPVALQLAPLLPAKKPIFHPFLL